MATTPATLPEPRYPAKIATTANALARIAALARPLVVTNGVFDLLHLGHVTYLEQAKALGASLVVAVNSESVACTSAGAVLEWRDRCPSSQFMLNSSLPVDFGAAAAR